ncbi:GDSL-like protein [Leptospira licerasiae serovar Varillal str. VAR 010]|uniref:GDSL-like protein n=2 Tax=Leptospira licerasiae TaxID=447106 RepID=A0ABP2RFM1_9LEPT|nr:GDSL-like protein [Leptospira licerasiae serovar Varillal str. VAR 010]EJZ43306.1 GDSL-like protein [Leptospira licerasiae str. MMD4847]
MEWERFCEYATTCREGGGFANVRPCLDKNIFYYTGKTSKGRFLKNMKRPVYYFLIIILFYFIGSVIYTIVSAYKVPENNLDSFLKSEDKTPKRYVVFLGDSITHGTVSYNYVQSLSENPKLKNFTFVNEGINSRLTYQILEKVDDTIRLSPEHIFILIGTNDAKAALNEEEYKGYNSLWNLPEVPNISTYEKNLKVIVALLKAETKAKIHLISIPVLGESLNSIPLKQSIAYSNVIRNIAKESNSYYIPLNETLVADLKNRPDQTEGEYTRNTLKMYWIIFKHFGLFQSWDKISDQSDLIFMTDGIHMNSRAGKILEEMIQKDLKE